MIANTNNVYIYYGLLILFWANILLIKVYLEFISAIKACVILENNIDYWRHIDNGFHLCKSCYSIIVKKKIPQFRSANYINILPY